VKDKVDLSEFMRVKKCLVGSLELSEEQRRKLNAALAYPVEEIPTTEIMRVLGTWGFKVKRTTLSEHRRQVCCCE
jgi:hypothetical protein